MELVFATANKNKLREISQMMGGKSQFLGLADIGCLEDVPETSDTIEGNAIQKAMYVFENYGKNCFSEDTGLEVTALGMNPGVKTARYAGEQRDPEANMAKVLAGLQGQEDRSARFKTVIALVVDGEVETFEGIVEGHIALAKRGDGGFGYDPVFVPEGGDRTFAEMGSDEKHGISHRARAFRKFMARLSEMV